MARSRPNVAHHAKKMRILKKAKGYWGARSKCYRIAKNAVLRAEQYATRDRRKRAGQFRRLWITRISAAVESEGISYSRFIHGLKRASIELNRKSLSELAIHNPMAFKEIVEKAKAALAAS